MMARQLEYTSGAAKFVGYLAFDEKAAGLHPGVVLFPEAFGLNDHARERALRLAQLGYVVLAADMNGGGVVNDDMAKVGPAIQALYSDRTLWRARARAALDALLAQPGVDGRRIAAIGFCFGGTTALELMRSGAPLAAVATFHSGLLPQLPEDAGRARARLLVCHGAEDPLVKKEAIDAFMDELRRDKTDWQFIHYGNAAHSFTDPEADKRKVPGLGYEKRAEARSWAAMRQLFDEAFA
jgi:dienelactone hydrolase